MPDNDLQYFRDRLHFSRVVDELTRRLPQVLAEFEGRLFDQQWEDKDFGRLRQAFVQELASVVTGIKLNRGKPARSHRSLEEVMVVHEAARLLERDNLTLASFCYATAHAEAIDNRSVPDRLRARIAADYGRFEATIRIKGELVSGELAEKLLREALELEKRLTPTDPRMIAFRKSNLAAVLLNRGDVEGGLRLLEEARKTCERVAPGDVVMALILANLHVALGRKRQPQDPHLLEEARHILDSKNVPAEHAYRKAILRISSPPDN